MTDIMSKARRSALMARIKGKNTGPERAMRSLLRRAVLRYRSHVKSLPGTPDFVMTTRKLVVFVDGCFWHGYRFPAWEQKLPPYWQKKIARNRRRDQGNFARLRRLGWRVLRVWEHELRDDSRVMTRIKKALASATTLR